MTQADRRMLAVMAASGALIAAVAFVVLLMVGAIGPGRRVAADPVIWHNPGHPAVPKAERYRGVQV